MCHYKEETGVVVGLMGKEVHASFPSLFQEEEMDFPRVLRYTILSVSTAAMLVGILVMAGLLVAPRVPGQLRVVLGVVIFLYGAYRFVVAFFRQDKARRHGL